MLWSAEIKDTLIDRIHPETGWDRYSEVRWVWIKIMWGRVLRTLGVRHEH